MSVEKIYYGSTEEEIWNQIASDLSTGIREQEFSSIINHRNYTIFFNINIDLGGGFQGSYETTSFTSKIALEESFKFAIHHQGFLDEIGKFFGMQDVVLGYPEFDQKVIVKTNDELRVKTIFAREEVRSVLQLLENYTVGITTHSDYKVLEFTIEEVITEIDRLRNLYTAFINILDGIEKSTGN